MFYAKRSSCIVVVTLTLLLAGALLLLAGCTEEAPEVPLPEEEPAEQDVPGNDAGDKEEEFAVDVTLYFPDEQVMYLLPEVRSVLPGDSLAQTVVEELLQGPVLPEHLAVLPQEVELLSVEVEDSIAYVNFNHALRQVQGSAAEIMAVYSVVNSLAKLPEVEKVSFLLEGRTVDALNHLALDEPLSPRWDLVPEE